MRNFFVENVDYEGRRGEKSVERKVTYNLNVHNYWINNWNVCTCVCMCVYVKNEQRRIVIFSKRRSGVQKQTGVLAMRFNFTRLIRTILLQIRDEV